MATLEKLVEDKTLHRVTIPLGDGQFHDRKLYVYPDCLTWMRSEVPKMVTGVIKSAFTPKVQMGVRFAEWMSGKPMVESRMFRHMLPLEKDVHELKTDDLRIFGWLCKPGVFIAVCGGYADDYKEPDKKKNYADEVRLVVQARSDLLLDGDKIFKGDFNELCGT